MPIRYGWLVDQHVLLTCMEGDVSAETFQRWAWDVNVFYDRIPHDKLHILIDASQLEKMPSIKQMLDIPVHEKRGWLIVIAMQNRLLKFLASTVVQVTRTDLKFVDTLDEALAVLHRMDLAVPEDATHHIPWLGTLT